MRYRNLMYLVLIYGLLFAFLYWMIKGYPGANLKEKTQYLLDLLRYDDSVLLKVTIVYAVCLSIPYILGGLGFVMVVLTGFKGVIYFMAGSMASMGTNFLIGRRFPILMAMFKRQIAKHLSQKEWWPQGEDVDIFRIIRYYFEEDRIGRRIYAALQRLPFKIRFNEQTIIFLSLLMPVNMVVGGGGGVALVSGEESTLSFFQYMKVVFYAHAVYVCLPWSLSFFVN